MLRPRNRRPFFSFVLCVLLWFIPCVRCVTVKVNGSDHIACGTDLSLSTPLESSPVTVQNVLAYCLTSPRCTELYGQVNGIKLDQFTFLLETTTEFSAPLYLETPINEYVCKMNATLLELNAVFWLLRLELDLVATGRACGVDQEPLFDEDTQTVNCVASPSYKSQHYDDWYALFVIFGLLIVVGIFGWLGIKVYQTAVARPPIL